MMDLTFPKLDIFERYKSNSQRIRVLSENWFETQMYCPACINNSIQSFGNNNPVADFFCPVCAEQYQVKSQSKHFSTRIVDGAYQTLVNALKTNLLPNFFFLHYDLNNLSILNLFLVPKFFFSESIIEKRKPLSDRARRAGWIGCNLLIANIPDDGKIQVVNNKSPVGEDIVRRSWGKVEFLKNQETKVRGWISDIMWCIEQLEKPAFALWELYAFEPHLKQLHEDNKNIQAKIRQQLQILRDANYLKFLGEGRYQLL